jgi:hypothetical protein
MNLQSSSVLSDIQRLERSSRTALPFTAIGLLAVLGSIYFSAMELRQTRAETEDSERQLVAIRAQAEERTQAVKEAESQLQKIREQISLLTGELNDVVQSSDRSTKSKLDSALGQTKGIESSLSAVEAQLAATTAARDPDESGAPAAQDGMWFPVVASAYTEADVRGKLQELQSQSLEYELGVYRASDAKGIPVYALSLGGGLSRSEASKRAEYARQKGIATDAYIWNSTRWGDNIARQFISAER